MLFLESCYRWTALTIWFIKATASYKNALSWTEMLFSEVCTAPLNTVIYIFTLFFLNSPRFHCFRRLADPYTIFGQNSEEIFPTWDKIYNCVFIGVNVVNHHLPWSFSGITSHNHVGYVTVSLFCGWGLPYQSHRPRNLLNELYRARRLWNICKIKPKSGRISKVYLKHSNLIIYHQI